MRFSTTAVSAIASSAIAAPAGSAKKGPSEDLCRIFNNLSNCDDCALVPFQHHQLLLVDLEGDVRDSMKADEADAAVMNELSIKMEYYDARVFAQFLDDLDCDDGKHLEKRQIKIPPVFRPFEQGDDDVEDDIHLSEGSPKAPAENDLEKRQIKIPPVFRPFEYPTDAVKTARTETPPPKDGPENPTKNARPYDQTPSYISPPEDNPPGTLPKRQWKTPPVFRPLTEPSTFEKRNVPPRTKLSTMTVEPSTSATPASTIPTDGPTATILPSDDEEEREQKRCAIPRKCTTSATCRGMCDACTYVAWYPYGLCMARDSGRGRIRD